jgi:hypothetical protein
MDVAEAEIKCPEALGAKRWDHTCEGRAFGFSVMRGSWDNGISSPCR